MIVLPDADYDASANAVISSVCGAAGQRCLAGSIVVGVGDAFPPIRERVLDGAASLRLGSGLDPDVTMGPVISAPHRERIARYVSQGEKEGARLLLDGRQATVSAYPAGHWFGPTGFEKARAALGAGRG